MKRDSFIFYRSFYEAITELPEKNQAELYKAICEYSLNMEAQELTGLSKTIFTLIRPQLEANNKRFLNGIKGGEHGKKGGRPSTNKPQDKPLNNPKLTPNSNVNVNVNDNVNVNIEERIAAFGKSLRTYIDSHAEYIPFAKDFFAYWTEHGEKEKKFRAEKQKSFGIGRRLSTWKKNSTKFDSNDKPTTTLDAANKFINR